MPRLKPGALVPNAQEDADIARGIAQDPDTFEVPDEQITQMKPQRGRPRLERPKEQVTMRLDADLLEALKASGPGWQSRVNDLLAAAVKLGRI